MELSYFRIGSGTVSSVSHNFPYLDDEEPVPVTRMNAEPLYGTPKVWVYCC